MKTEMVKCKSGVWGSQGKLRDNYDSFEEFKHYSHIHNLHARLGYKSSKAAWKANPTIQWSVIPTDFSKVKVQKPLVPTVVFDHSKPPPNCPYCNGEREWVDKLYACCYFCGK